MNVSAGGISSVSSWSTHYRSIEFRSPVRVSAPGAENAAKNPFSGLIELAPKTVGPNHRAALEEAEEVSEADRISLAKQAIRELQQARMAHEDDSDEKVAAQKACLACKTIDIMV